MPEYLNIVTEGTIAVVGVAGGDTFYPCETNGEIAAVQTRIRVAGGEPVVFYRAVPPAVTNINSGSNNFGIQANTVHGGVRIG